VENVGYWDLAELGDTGEGELREELGDEDITQCGKDSGDGVCGTGLEDDAFYQ
jgi:hypothetical protein